MVDPMTRTDSTQAMQSLFSAYADDEGEEEEAAPWSHLDISGSEDEASREVPTPVKVEKRTTENEQQEPKKPRLETKVRSATRLVSYGPDDMDEEDDSREINEDEIEDDGVSEAKLVNYDVSFQDASFVSRNSSTTDDVRLPPEPTGKCSTKVQEKIAKLYERMRREGLNDSIQKRKDFRNPSIYEKLIDFCRIDEKGTNYPPELYNPLLWGKESYYDELAKLQKIEMDKREKEKKDRTKVEFVTATKKSSSEDPKRKSKWDTQPPTGTSSVKPVAIPTTVAAPPVVSVTSTASGNKTTIISAIGTIKKSK